MKSTILIYCFLAYLFSWGSKFMISANEVNWIPLIMPKGVLQLLAQFGPTLAGLIIISCEKGRDGIFSVVKSLTRFKIAIKWYVFALFLEFILFIIIALFFSITGYGNLEINWSLFWKGFWIFFTSAVSLTLLTGLGEEIGWRGFLLPKLQSRYSAIITALIISFIVSIWHLRIDCITLLLKSDFHGFFALYLPDMGLRLMISIPVMFMQIYLFNKTRGSLVIMILFHGTANASYEWFKHMSGSDDPAAALPVFAVLLWLTAVFFIPAVIKQGKNRELVTSVS